MQLRKERSNCRNVTKDLILLADIDCLAIDVDE